MSRGVSEWRDSASIFPLERGYLDTSELYKGAFTVGGDYRVSPEGFRVLVK